MGDRGLTRGGEMGSEPGEVLGRELEVEDGGGGDTSIDSCDPLSKT